MAVDPLLIHYLEQAESDHQDDAIGPMTKYGRAIGPRQILEGTFAEYADPGMDIFNPEHNREVGDRIINDYTEMFGGDTELGLAAYNAGPGNIRKYLNRTESGTWEEVAQLMEQDNSFSETRNYVKKIMNNYSKHTGAEVSPSDAAAVVPAQEEAGPPKVEPSQIDPTIVPGTFDDFVESMGAELTTPDFLDLPAPQKINKLLEVYNSKDWNAPDKKDIYNSFKDLTTGIWENALPEEQLNFEALVGSPPQVEKGQNPEEVLQGWKDMSIQKLFKAGYNPAMFGKQLDDYLDYAADIENQAYTARNRSTANYALNRLGNYVREGAKGVTRVATDAAAGVTRLAGGGENEELANTIQNLPEVWLGAPANDFLYVTDDNGYPVQNPDGTFQRHWQSDIAQGIGSIGAMIGTLGAGSLVGVPTRVLAAANIGVDSLGMANFTFGHVYEQTQDPSKAYTAALFTLPAGAIGALGEMGIVAGLYRPTLRGAERWATARFLGQQFARNAAIGAASNAAADVIQQTGEVLQTGEDYSSERTAMAGVIGALGSGLAGTAFDYVAARSDYSTVRRPLEDAATEELLNFSQSLAQTATLNARAEYITPNTAKDLGVNVTPGPNGEAQVTRVSDIILPPDADVPTLVNTLEAYMTPKEHFEISQRFAERYEGRTDLTPEQQAEKNQMGKLVEAPVDPVYLNNQKAVEAAIHEKLKADPGALPYTYSTTDNLWRNVETGRKASFLKDLINEDKLPRWNKDLADVSYLKLFDEDAFTPVLPDDVALQQDVSDVISFDITSTRRALTADKEVLRALSTENRSVEAANKSRNNLIERRAKRANKVIDSITDLETELSRLPAPREEVPVSPEATQATRELLPQLEETRARILDLKNALDEAPEDTRAAIRDEIREQTIQRRDLEAQLLRLKEGVRQANEGVKLNKETIRAQNKRDTLETRMGRLYDELDDLLQPLPEVGSPRDLTQYNERITQRQRQLEGLQDKKARQQQQLRWLKDAEQKYRAAKNKADKVRLKGLGAIIHTRTGGEIIIPEGLSPAKKAEVYAHEVSHALTDKIGFSPEVRALVQEELAALRAASATESAATIADRVILPKVREELVIPENATFSALDKKSQDALLSEREYLANQIGAVALKRSGYDIGDYNILPAIEEALYRVRLPEIPNFSKRDTPDVSQIERTILGEDYGDSGYREAPIRDEDTSGGRPSPSEGPQPVIERQSRPVREEAPSETINPAREGTQAADEVSRVLNEEVPVRDEAQEALQNLDIFGDDLRETRMSQYVRDTLNASDIPQQAYITANRKTSYENARAYIDRFGIEKTIEVLQSKEGQTALPGQRTVLADALVKAAQERGTADDLYRAYQIRANIGTPYAQAIGLLDKYQGQDSFVGIIKQLQKTFRQAGLSDEMTEYMLKELSLAYKAVEGLPPGVIRDKVMQRIIFDTIKKKEITVPEFFPRYIKANMLSGIGTSVINTTSGVWMGPLITALKNPFAGNLLAWRTLWNTKGIAYSQAKRILKGEIGSEFVGGLTDAVPIPFHDDRNAATKILSAIDKKFGTKVYRVLQAMDAFNRTLTSAAYSNIKEYKALRETYGNNPGKLAAESAKLILTPEDVSAAKVQAKREFDALKLNYDDNDVAVRAYEIVRQRDVPAETLMQARDWADGLSLRGETANVIPQLFDAFLEAGFWNKSSVAKALVFPFGRAMVRLADMGSDLIPGHTYVDAALRKIQQKTSRNPLESKSAVLAERAAAGQKIGLGLTAGFLGAVLTDAIQITTETPQVLSRSGGDLEDKKASNRQQFREAAQTGIPEYSVIFPGGFAFRYADFPGLSAILYGVGKAKEAIDKGKPIPFVVSDFYFNAFKQATPFLGESSLSAPYQRLVEAFTDPDFDGDKLRDRLESAASKAAQSVSRMVIPASSLLADIKKVYDETPEETNQNIMVKFFKDVPAISEMLGSKATLDRFGDPIERTLLEQVPGVGRVATAVKVPSDDVARALIEKGIITPELPTRVRLTARDFDSPQQQEQYTANREERISKAYSGMLTPDEWYDFIKATGPQIKRVAAEIVNLNIPTDELQKIYTKRVKDIERQAKKQYIRTGKFQ